MVVISEKKKIEAVCFETIIKRCPICLVDTQQAAYYALAPNLSVTFTVDADPPCRVTVLQNLEHVHKWQVLAKCSVCNYTYRVSGVPSMKVKDIPTNISNEEHELALTCCDVCYNEYYKYTVSDVFIRLSNFGNIYLCSDHAKEVEQERRKEGGYTSLEARLSRWSIVKEKPISLKIDDGRQIILKSNKDLSTGIIELLARNEQMPLASIQKAPKFKGRRVLDINDAIGYLKGMSLVQEVQQGIIMRKQTLSLTEDGRKAADAITRRYSKK